MEKTEKSIRSIGIYFVVLGFIRALLEPLYFPILGTVGPICVILMCLPRLMGKNKQWASVSLMIGAVLSALALLCFDVLLTLGSYILDQMDVTAVVILSIITVVMLLSCYLCYRLFKLLFKTNETE